MRKTIIKTSIYIFMITMFQMNNAYVLKAEDINQTDPTGTTGLMRAASSGSLNVAVSLIAKGANVNAVTNFTEEYFKYRISVLQHAASYDVAKLLIANGADINYKDYGDKTALMYAAEKGLKDVVKLLIEKGADVNAVNKNGQSALTLATEYKKMDIVKILKKKGAK